MGEKIAAVFVGALRLFHVLLQQLLLKAPISNYLCPLANTQWQQQWWRLGGAWRRRLGGGLAAAAWRRQLGGGSSGSSSGGGLAAAQFGGSGGSSCLAAVAAAAGRLGGGGGLAAAAVVVALAWRPTGTFCSASSYQDEPSAVPFYRVMSLWIIVISPIWII